MFSIFKRQFGGEIGYYGLSDWWEASFTPEERRIIKSTFRPLGMSPKALTEGKITYSSGNVVSFLSGLAGWFKKEKTRSIAYRMLKKAEESEDTVPVLDKHFLQQAKIDIYYRFRDVDRNALSMAIEACKRQIAISDGAAKAFREEYPEQDLPAHTGYEQLAIIYDKQGKWNDAIEVCRKALEQGWAGDWQKRIERYEKQMKKHEIEP